MGCQDLWLQYFSIPAIEEITLFTCSCIPRMCCEPCAGQVYLCLGDDGDASYDLRLIRDLFLGSNDIRQNFLVLWVLLAVRHFWNLKKNAGHEKFDDNLQRKTQLRDGHIIIMQHSCRTDNLFFNGACGQTSTRKFNTFYIHLSLDRWGSMENNGSSLCSQHSI